MPEDHVEALAVRSNGKCEAGCGKAATQIHHRRFTGRGGRHNLANLLHLCGSGNHTGCHGVAHKGRAPAGWAISRHDLRDEAQIPFVDLGGRTRWLDDLGGKHARPQMTRKE